MNNLVTTDQVPADQELWLAIRNGDEKAYATLFERYHRVLYNYGCKLTKDTDLIEDAVQDVFIDIWRLRNNLTAEITSVKFYLFRAVRRRIQGLVGRLGATDELDLLSEKTLTDYNDDPALIARESADLLSKRIHTLITSLPPRQMEVLTLRYFDDFSVHEIAILMEINEKSVRNLLFKAISSLRERRDWLIISLLPPVFILGLF